MAQRKWNTTVWWLVCFEASERRFTNLYLYSRFMGVFTASNMAVCSFPYKRYPSEQSLPIRRIKVPIWDDERLNPPR